MLLALSVAAMFVASRVAIFQHNLKRMLAYSSVGADRLHHARHRRSPMKPGSPAAIVHLFNHAVIKGALFLVLGAVVCRIGGVKLARPRRASAGRCRSPWRPSSSAGLA